jgi:succinyl-CoA synthetase alpha subunit
MSRSGGQTTTVAWAICESGLGVSTAVHVGSEPVVGTNFAELLPFFEKDKDTHAVVMFGEIGTVAEEEAAEVVKEGGFTKPLVAYIAGAHAKEGVRFSHASAIIEGGRGTAQSKMDALNNVGATIVDTPMDIAKAVGKLLKR